MSNRPATWFYGETLYWTLFVYDANGNLVNADSTPTVAVRVNGASYAVTSVTITKRAATTGIYDCSFVANNSGVGAAYGLWQFEETATISGTDYVNGWNVHQVDNSAQQITDAVLDEDVLSHQTASSVGWKIQDTNTRSASTLTIVGSLNDFDPTTDVVANVSNVTTVGSVTNPVTTANSSDVTAIKDVTDKLDTALVLDGAVYQYTTNALENAPTGGGGSAPSAADIYNYFTSGTNEDAFKADVTALATTAQLNALNNISANDVYLEFVNGSNADAFKANVSALATSAEISSLNDFDPASDVVANVNNVTTVGTCTTNTDMRGTDNANTIAPDNAGITANGNAIGALNDFDPTTQLVMVQSIATNAITAASLKADAVVEIQTGLVTVGDTFTHTNQSGDTMTVTIS